jgi:septal ring factor EnvC (AmiA/AmiB activator)
MIIMLKKVINYIADNIWLGIAILMGVMSIASFCCGCPDTGLFALLYTILSAIIYMWQVAYKQLEQELENLKKLFSRQSKQLSDTVSELLDLHMENDGLKSQIKKTSKKTK